MISLVDQILDIATQFDREEARVLLTELLSTGISQAPPKMVDKEPGKPVPVTLIAPTRFIDTTDGERIPIVPEGQLSDEDFKRILRPHGDYTDAQGRRATVYTHPSQVKKPDGPPPTQPNLARPGNDRDQIERSRKEMNDLSKAIVDKTMGKT